MKYAILLHAGGLARVPTAITLAERHPEALVYFGLECAEAVAVRDAIGASRVVVRGKAFDTLTEAVNVLPAVIVAGVTDLIVTTEPGHLGRAAMIARILAWRRPVRILAHASAPDASQSMTYRSPYWVTVADWWRAWIVRLTGRVMFPSNR